MLARDQGRALAERKGALVGGDFERIALSELAGQDAARQRVLDLALDQSLQRARSEHRIVAPLRELGQSFV